MLHQVGVSFEDNWVSFFINKLFETKKLKLSYTQLKLFMLPGDNAAVKRWIKNFYRKCHNIGLLGNTVFVSTQWENIKKTEKWMRGGGWGEMWSFAFDNLGVLHPLEKILGLNLKFPTFNLSHHITLTRRKKLTILRFNTHQSTEQTHRLLGYQMYVLETLEHFLCTICVSLRPVLPS